MICKIFCVCITVCAYTGQHSVSKHNYTLPHYWMWDALLDVYLVRPESSVTSTSIVQGISDLYGVILEVEWEDTCTEPQVERVVPV
jgi:hypothetical protein